MRKWILLRRYSIQVAVYAYISHISNMGRGKRYVSTYLTQSFNSRLPNLKPNSPFSIRLWDAYGNCHSPYPPPPGVSMRSLSPAWKRLENLAGSRVSLFIYHRSIYSGRGAPSAPPLRPQGAESLLSLSIVTVAGRSNSYSRHDAFSSFIPSFSTTIGA